MSYFKSCGKICCQTRMAETVLFISIINTLKQIFKDNKWYFLLCEEHIKVIPIGGGRRGYRE